MACLQPLAKTHEPESRLRQFSARRGQDARVRKRYWQGSDDWLAACSWHMDLGSVAQRTEIEGFSSLVGTHCSTVEPRACCGVPSMENDEALVGYPDGIRTHSSPA